LRVSDVYWLWKKKEKSWLSQWRRSKWPGPHPRYFLQEWQIQGLCMPGCVRVANAGLKVIVFSMHWRWPARVAGKGLTGVHFSESGQHRLDRSRSRARRAEEERTGIEADGGSRTERAWRERNMGNGSIQVPEGKVFYMEWSTFGVERSF
jgi:hypothetical protein